jgi:prepilin-type N-terminal cleavage/methylation domain-containing protein
VYEKTLIATRRRSAFTLIELLVVIAIIAILASLLLVGVVMIIRKGPVAKNTSEILNISEALQQFRTKNNGYPPSILKLCSDRSAYGNSAVDVNSLALLNQMYPQIGNFTGMNWGGRPGFVAAPATVDILDGDQALVFALAGPPIAAGIASQGMKGFSTNAQNPLDPAGDRKKYYDFPVDRLYNRDMTTGPAKAFLLLTTGNANFYAASVVHPFPSFLDAFGTAMPGQQPLGMPLVYFSANRRANGYDQVPNSLDVVPYCLQRTTLALKFYNSDTYQLISAGPDGVRAPANGGFGKGGTWPVTATWSAATNYLPFDAVTFNGMNYLCVSANTGSPPPSVNWKANPFMNDDYSNFTDKALGVIP